MATQKGAVKDAVMVDAKATPKRNATPAASCNGFLARTLFHK
jgi:hypothetical protein